MKNKYIIEKILNKGVHGKIQLCHAIPCNDLCKNQIIQENITSNIKYISELVVLKIIYALRTHNYKDQTTNKNDIFSTILNEVKISNICCSKGHPNVIEYLDSFITDTGDLAIVYSYCNGGDLSAFLHKLSLIRNNTEDEEKQDTNIVDDNILYTLKNDIHDDDNGDNNTVDEEISIPQYWIPEQQLWCFFSNLLFGIAHIHSMKIIHRDLKSSNIFIHTTSHNEKVLRIGDFGSSKLLSQRDNCIQQEQTGTPYYLAPEVIQSYPYSYKSDMWSLGVIMYEMLTLHKPFRANNLKSLSNKVLRAKYPPIPKYYSFSITKVVSSLLKQEPSHRPSALSLLTLPQLLVYIPLEYKHSLLRVLYPSVYSPLCSLEGNQLYTPPYITNMNYNSLTIDETDEIDISNTSSSCDTPIFDILSLRDYVKHVKRSPSSTATALQTNNHLSQDFKKQHLENENG